MEIGPATFGATGEPQVRLDRPPREAETPRTAEAGTVELRYYPEARRLQVHGRFRGDGGEWRTRNVVTLALEDLALSPAAIRLLRGVTDAAADIGAPETPARAGRGRGA